MLLLILKHDVHFSRIWVSRMNTTSILNLPVLVCSYVTRVYLNAALSNVSRHFHPFQFAINLERLLGHAWEDLKKPNFVFLQGAPMFFFLLETKEEDYVVFRKHLLVERFVQNFLCIIVVCANLRMHILLAKHVKLFVLNVSIAENVLLVTQKFVNNTSWE